MTPATLDQPPEGLSLSAQHAAKLKRMAGQIAGFFQAYPDEQAVASIADHINQFWTRRMREDFVTAFSATPEDLPPLLRLALPHIHRAHGG